MAVYRPFGYDEKARAALCGADEILNHTIHILQGVHGDWNENKIKTAIEIIALDNRKKIGQVFLPLRAALFGRLEGADLTASIAVLGKNETLVRIFLALNLERLRMVKKIDKAIIAAVSILA
jgi:glutamyl/glutaminyl-tRNA synthetase